MHLLLQNPQSRELLFTELAQLTRSAVPMSRVAELMANRRIAVHRTFGLALQRGLAINASLPQAMKEALDPMELAVVSAADSSGQLTEGFSHLAKYYGQLNRTRRHIIAGLLYPILVLNVAVVVQALVTSLGGGGNMALSIGKSLLVLWSYMAAWFLLCFICHKLASTSTLVDSILRHLPLTGKVRRLLSLSRWCLASHFQLLAGRNFGEAFHEGGLAAQSAVLHQFSERAAARARSGQEIGPVFLSSRAIPEAFGSGVASAEIAGRMDEQLAAWTIRTNEEADLALANLITWLPKIVFAIAAVATFYTVFQYGAGQAKQYDDLLDSMK